MVKHADNGRATVVGSHSNQAWWCVTCNPGYDRIVNLNIAFHNAHHTYVLVTQVDDIPPTFA